MNNVTPTDANCLFILCEDVRQEPGNKLTVLGLFAGGDLGVAGPNTTLPSLTFIFWIRDGQGKFKAKLKLVDSTGATVVDSDIGDTEKKPNEALTVVTSFKPFTVKQPGKYEVTLSLDGQSYKREFLAH